MPCEWRLAAAAVLLASAALTSRCATRAARCAGTYCCSCPAMSNAEGVS